MDDHISMDEMLDFFDSSMPDGKKYDRELAKKIFNLFDIDHNGKISVDEFIKTFIHIEEELKSHRYQIKAKYLAEKDKYDDLLKKTNMYRGESLNSQGIAPSATLKCEITEVEFLRSTSSFESIKIRLTFDDCIKTTKAISAKSNKLYWKEMFEL